MFLKRLSAFWEIRFFGIPIIRRNKFSAELSSLKILLMSRYLSLLNSSRFPRAIMYSLKVCENRILSRVSMAKRICSSKSPIKLLFTLQFLWAHLRRVFIEGLEDDVKVLELIKIFGQKRLFRQLLAMR